MSILKLLFAVIYALVLLASAYVGYARAQTALPPAVAGSAVSGVQASAAPAGFRGGYATCTASCYLMVFNSATTPASGATTAGNGLVAGALVHCVGPSLNPSMWYDYQNVEFFNQGVYVGISSTGCATFTPSSVGFIHATAR